MLTIPIPMFGVDGSSVPGKKTWVKWPVTTGWKKEAGPESLPGNSHAWKKLARAVPDSGENIYAAFLQECAEILRQPLLKDLSGEMTAIGDAWRNFAWQAARCFKNRDKGLITYDMRADLLVIIADQEREQIFAKLRGPIETMTKTRTWPMILQNLTKYYRGI